ncbi:MAG: hypothetical protein ACRD22_21165 [Terriglobia bacterium]
MKATLKINGADSMASGLNAGTYEVEIPQTAWLELSSGARKFFRAAVPSSNNEDPIVLYTGPVPCGFTATAMIESAEGAADSVEAAHEEAALLGYQFLLDHEWAMHINAGDRDFLSDAQIDYAEQLIAARKAEEAEAARIKREADDQQQAAVKAAKEEREARKMEFIRAWLVSHRPEWLAQFDQQMLCREMVVGEIAHEALDSIGAEMVCSICHDSSHLCFEQSTQCLPPEVWARWQAICAAHPEMNLGANGFREGRACLRTEGNADDWEDSAHLGPMVWGADITVQLGPFLLARLIQI